MTFPIEEEGMMFTVFPGKIGAVISLGIVATLGAGAFPAAAQSDEIEVSAPREDPNVLLAYVSYDDLDLTSERGESRLVTRVRKATREVCPPAYTTQMAYAHTARCKRIAWSGAEPQIDLAVERARQIAATGHSDIPPVRISLMVPR